MDKATKPTITIGIREAIEILTVIVGNFGADHTAKAADGSAGCTYIEDPDAFILKPVCIVGQVFAVLGILRVVLRTASYGSDQYGACTTDSLLWVEAEALGIFVTDEARRFFREVQYNQDSGRAWGEALSRTITSFRHEAEQNFRDNHPLWSGEAQEVAPL